MAAKLEIKIVTGVSSKKQDKKIDALIEKRQNALRKLGAKSFEGVFVEDGKARSLQYG